MKNLISIILILILSLTIIMCSGEKNQEIKQKTDSESTVKSELVDCPGCNMKMEKSKMITHVTNGDTLYFCSEYCKENYLAKQEKKSM
jgi:YHS domain-containing protein